MTSASTFPQITVHWLEKSRAQRVLWLLEESHVPYSIKVYKRGADHLAPPSLKQIHSLGKAPVLTVEGHEREDALVLAESGAIFEYVVDRFKPDLAPENDWTGETWRRYKYFMHYAEGSLMSLLMRIHTIHGIPGTLDGPVGSNLRRNLKTHLEFLEGQIQSSPGGGEFLCGRSLTAADVMMCFPLLVVEGSMGGLGEFPGLQAYVAGLVGRDAYTRAIERAEAASGNGYEVV